MSDIEQHPEREVVPCTDLLSPTVELTEKFKQLDAGTLTLDDFPSIAAPSTENPANFDGINFLQFVLTSADPRARALVYFHARGVIAEESTSISKMALSISPLFQGRYLEAKIIDGKLHANEKARDNIQRMVIATLLTRPRAEAYHFLCETVRRITHTQQTTTKAMLSLNKWDENRAHTIISSLSDFVVAICPSSPTLLDYYTENFSRKSYQQIIDTSCFGVNASKKTKDLNILYGKSRLDTLKDVETLSYLITPDLRILVLDSFLLPHYKGATSIMKETYARALTLHPFRDIADMQSLIMAHECLITIKQEAPELALKCTEAFLAAAKRALQQCDISLRLLLIARDPGYDFLFGDESMENLRLFATQVTERNVEKVVTTALDKWGEDAVIFSYIYEILPPKVRAAMRTHLADLGYINNRRRDLARASVLALDTSFHEEIIAKIKTCSAIENESDNLKKALAPIYLIAGKRDLFAALSMTIDTIIDQKQHVRTAEDARRAAEHAGRQQVTKTATIRVIEEPEPEPLPPSPHLMLKEWNALIRDALGSGRLPAEILNSSVSLAGLQTTLENGLLAVMVEQDAKPWSEGETRQIPPEATSPLTALGVTSIAFTKKGDTYGVELFFEKMPPIGGEARRFNSTTLTAEGDVTFPDGAFAGFASLEYLVRIETLRLFCKMHGVEESDASLEAVRILLGLDRYVAPTAPPRGADAAIPSSAPASPSVVVTPPAAVVLSKAIEDPRIQNTTDFQTENLSVFESFVSYLRDEIQLEIPQSYDALANYGKNLQGAIRTNNQLDAGGMKTLPSKGNLLAPQVESITFHSVAESHLALGLLDIDPLFFHELLIDAYLGRVNVRCGDDMKQITFCVLPPKFEVYIIGVDSRANEEDENKIFALLRNLILHCFYNAVTFEYDPKNRDTSGTGEKKGKQGTWAAKVDEAIKKASKGSFPVIVTSWKERQKKQKEGGNTEEEPAAPHEEPSLEQLFYKLYDRPGTMEAGLAAHGLFLDGETFVSVPELMKLDRFPHEAWIGRSGERHLKKNFAEIRVPLKTEDEVVAALRSANEPLVPLGELTDSAIQYFGNDVTYGANPEESFEEFFFENATSIDSHLRMRCISYGGEDLADGLRPQELFKTVLTRAQQLDATITAQDVFEAFVKLSRMPLSAFTLSIKRARDFRLPYLFREGGEGMPAAAIFEQASLEVDPQMQPEVLKIIAGNRVRMSEVNDLWIMGCARSPELDLAAELQNEWSIGDEIDLSPRARALLVWEFKDGTYAFTYLDEARDAENPITHQTVSAPDRLRRFASVDSAVVSAIAHNSTGNHPDFTTMRHWKHSELERLEKEGVLKLRRKGRRIIGIDSAKEISRKRVAILTAEQPGYRQFRVAPTNLLKYAEFLHKEGGENLPEYRPYDPKITPIQEIFHQELGL